MKEKRLGVSVKFVSIIAVIYSALIIILSFSFNTILKTNSDILKEVLLTNNEYLLMERAEMIIEKLKNEEIKNLKSLSKLLYKYCNGDDNFLYAMVFSKTTDDDFFKVRRKIRLNPHIKLKIKRNSIVQEKKDINYLRVGLLEKTVDPKIYSSKGLFWQCIYYPYNIGKYQFVIEFLISSSKISTALNEYSVVINKTKKNIIFITGIVILAVVVITLLFIYNFNRIIKNLTKYMRRAAEGEMDISLKQTNDNDLNELALSFNTIVSELKGLREKESLVKDMEEKDTLNDLFKFGVNMLKENKFDDSISIFKTLTMLKPDGFGSYFNLGVAFAKKREFDNSISMFQKALDSNPNHELTNNYINKVKRLQGLNEQTLQQN